MQTETVKKKTLLSELESYLEEKGIQDSKVAIACSAGSDSMALLDIFSRLYPKNLIYCIHLDHGIREGSKLAIDFLKDYCEAKEIKFIHKSFAHGEIDSDENNARNERYKFFNEACEKEGIENIFLAHHLNDDAETILFRIIRGTNSYGLKGIPHSRELAKSLSIHRPFLDLKKEEISDYIQENNLSFIEDESNRDTKYARNKIRQEILPLCNEINPAATDNLKQLSKLISEEQDFINEHLDSALKDLGAQPWNLEDFRSLAKVIQRRVLEREFTTNIRFCNEFLEAIEKGGFHKINFSKDRFFVIRKKQIYLESEAKKV